LEQQILQFFQENGLAGLMILAFVESFISPILPDVLLIPMCLANPSMAIYYAGATTLASVVGGFIGYSIGAWLGPVAVNRFIPKRHWDRIKNLAEKHGGWAVFWGAIAPIPYKFVSISAGVLGLNRRLFLLITILGRSKRFLLIGILLYYVGPSVLDYWAELDDYRVWIIVGVVVVSLVIMKVCFSWKKAPEGEEL